MERKQDIQNEADVRLMVDSFYTEVQKDENLSYIFNDFAKVDWDTHLAKMYSFWNTLIFAKQSYKGNPFAAHVPLPIENEHFTVWLRLFEDNIDKNFQGRVAEETKLRARSIAHIFRTKLEHMHNAD